MPTWSLSNTSAHLAISRDHEKWEFAHLLFQGRVECTKAYISFADECRKSLTLQSGLWYTDSSTNHKSLHRSDPRPWCIPRASKCLLHIFVQNKVEVNATQEETSLYRNAPCRHQHTWTANHAWTCLVACRLQYADLADRHTSATGQPGSCVGLCHGT